MNTKKPLKVAIIGYGKMGGAMHQGWEKQLPDAVFYVYSPDQTEKQVGQTTFYIGANDTASQNALKSCDIVILSVKPQVMEPVCNSYKDFISADALIISVAAGISSQRYATFFGHEQPVIRAMPNTPCAVGKGVTGVAPNTNCSEAQIDLAMTLLGVSGEAVRVKDDDEIDRLSAVSGSGPAYVFYMVELLAQAGVKNGLDNDLAMSLARSTVIGGAALLDSDRDTGAGQLRVNVTSPGGTTEAALNHLMDGRIQSIFDDALAAAINRAKQL